MRTNWFLSGLMLLLMITPAWAEVRYTEEAEADVSVVRMSVTPAAEPVPALEHRFVARSIDLKPGNAAPYYYRAMMESAQVIRNLRDKFDEETELSRWYTTGEGAASIDELPLDKVRTASDSSKWVVEHYLADASSRRDCQWELGVEDIRGTEIISFLLPEFQNCRELARLVCLQTRLAIAERRYDDAIALMQMNYRLGRDTAQPPFLVCGLIGIAIENLTNGTVIDLIASPDSPNLYWALTALPDPLVDLQPAARFELDFGPRMFPFIEDAATTDRAQGEWNRLFTQAIGDLSQLAGPDDLIGITIYGDSDVSSGLLATGIGLLGYSHAKEQLIAQGMDPARVEQMAVGQVMAVYTAEVYQRLADEFETLWHLPYWEMRQRIGPVEHELRQADVLSGSARREAFPLVNVLMPAMQAARAAQVRLDRDLAALRVIEALRMYAAANDGRLPKKLNEIKQVPVPDNPATGKPFEYRLEGNTAILELSESDGIPGYNRRYEIQIASK